MNTNVFKPATALLVVAALSTSVWASSPNLPQTTAEGLVRVDSQRIEALYHDPDADLTHYTAIRALAPQVKFKKNWLRDTNRGSMRRVTHSDMEQIRADVEAVLAEVFTAELENQDRFEVVTEPGDNVLDLQVAVIDLDVNAPDVNTISNIRTFTKSAGTATLIIEMEDSTSGDLLVVAADRREARDNLHMEWATKTSNSAEARRLFKRWADLLIAALREVPSATD